MDNFRTDLGADIEDMREELAKRRALETGKKRPVKCCFCKKQLYYVGNKKHEPEVKLEVSRNYKDWIEDLYAHKRCYNEWRKQ